nr:hypothetical protein BaRGS_033584 [Batillaria attramentaria]
MLGSYGSLARYRNCSRLLRVNEDTVLGASGDYADYQFLTSIIKQRVIDEECLDDGFLGYVDKIGIAYEADTVATGFGAYIALPILRDAYEKNKKMDEKQAMELMEKCMKLLFYRDARSLNKGL